MGRKQKKAIAAAGVCLLCFATLLCRAAESSTPGADAEKGKRTGYFTETEEIQEQPERNDTEEIQTRIEAEGPKEMEGEAETEKTAQPEESAGTQETEKVPSYTEPEEERDGGEDTYLPDPEETFEAESEEETDDVEKGTDDTEGEQETIRPEEEMTNCIRRIIYHRHTGSTASGGGCHQAKREWTTTETKRCNNKLRPSGGSEKGKGVCDACGGYSSRSSGTCGRVKESKTIHHVAYDRNCGRTENTQLAELWLTWDSAQWSRSVRLQAGCRLLEEGCSVKAEPFLWNGGEPTAQDVMEVTKNGVYTLQLNMDENSNTGAALISYTVKNIDHTAPEIQEIDWEKEEFVTEMTVTVTAQDLQPAEECMEEDPMGCGLAKEAYSFDGGKTWQKENQAVLQNGSHLIAVRDRLGNTAVEEIRIDKVDNKGPAILSITKDPSTWTRKNVTVTVTAQDQQPDLAGENGEETGIGCGLAQKAWSFDGGETFQEEGSYCAEDNGRLELVVRDKLGNETRRSLEISNIDREKPHISVTQKPEKWVEGALQLHIRAWDGESGLPDRPFSWDGGTSWTYKTEREVSESEEGFYKVLVRDRAGNQNYEELNIVREEPELITQETPEEMPQEEPGPAAVEKPAEARSMEQPLPKEPSAQVKLPERKAAGPDSSDLGEELVETLELAEEGNLWEGLLKILAGLLALALLLEGLLLLLQRLYRRVEVYVRGDREEYSLVMKGRLIKKRHQYYLNLPGEKIGRSDYTHIKLVMPRLFAAGHKGGELTVMLEGVELLVKIEKEIHLS